MTAQQFREGRRTRGWTQLAAAARLGVSQPYLSQLESGSRPVPQPLARKAVRLYRLRPTALPVELGPVRAGDTATELVRQLAALGYPGFTHRRGARPANPSAVLLAALHCDDLDVRITEALPWLLLSYPDMDWPLVVRTAKLNNWQNRLGFLVALALQVARSRPEWLQSAQLLAPVAQDLERARLAAEDTLCQASLPVAERRWLAQNRSDLARHWNLLTGLMPEHLSYATP